MVMVPHQMSSIPALGTTKLPYHGMNCEGKGLSPVNIR
jgi:hypothetical protein